MSTPAKVLLIFAIVLIGLHFFPFTVFPFSIIAFFLGIIGAALGLGFSILATVGLALLLAMLGVMLGLVAALSPIWIPALIVVGIVLLMRRTDRSPSQPPLPAQA